MNRGQSAAAAKARHAEWVCLVAGGATLQQVADHYGVTRQAVSLGLRAVGVSLAEQKEQARALRNAEIIRRYNEAQETVEAIAAACGVGYRTVCKVAHQPGTPRRSIMRAAQLEALATARRRAGEEVVARRVKIRELDGTGLTLAEQARLLGVSVATVIKDRAALGLQRPYRRQAR